MRTFHFLTYLVLNVSQLGWYTVHWCVKTTFICHCQWSHTELQRIQRVHLSMIITVLIYPLFVGNETFSVDSSRLFLIFNNPVQGKNKAVMQHLK